MLKCPASQSVTSNLASMYLYIMYFRLVPSLRNINADAEQSGKYLEMGKEKGVRWDVVPSKMMMGTSRIGPGAGFSAFSGDLESDKFCPQQQGDRN